MSAGDHEASAVALERELAARGVRCRVQARDALALLSVSAELPEHAGWLREIAVPLARRHGFSHVALELPDGAADRAALSRD